MKRVNYLLLSLGLFISFSTYVMASGVSISGNTSITKGSSVTVTASVNSDSPLVSIEGSFSCKGAGTSEGVDMVFDDSSNSVKNKSYSITVRPTSSGSIICSTSGVRITNMSSDSWQSLADKSMTITVKEPVVVPPKTYSSNNNLKSLSVEGYSLSSEFNKDTLEYNVEVPNGTTKVNIISEKEDNTARVSGAGEREVVEGTNKFEIKVEAENGNVKTYVINVIVKELDPITVTVNGKSYTIIRKEGVLEEPTNYEKSTVKIGEEDVLCYKNNKTKDILIGLKDDKGNSSYFIYDEKTGKYSPYNNITINGISLKLVNMPKDEIPSDYSKINFKYDDKSIEGYQYIKKGVTYAADEKVKGSSFYLIYAVNEETGKEGLYVYDKEENTIQRYNPDIVLFYQNKLEKENLYLYISTAAIVILFVTLVVIVAKKERNKKRR